MGIRDLLEAAQFQKFTDECKFVSQEVALEVEKSKVLRTFFKKYIDIKPITNIRNLAELNFPFFSLFNWK